MTWITDETAPEQDAALNRIAEGVLAYLAEHPGRIPAATLLADVAKELHVPEAQVATAISRITGHLARSYSRAGTPCFALTEVGS